MFWLPSDARADGGGLTDASGTEGIGAEQFSIVWEGSFFARDTGLYEFRTSTPNGVRLYINTPIR